MLIRIGGLILGCRPRFELMLLRSAYVYSRTHTTMTIFPIVTYSHYSAAHLNEEAKTRILAIDDEESIRYAVDAGLEFLGDFDVNFAEDGIKGIQLLKDFAPNLVLVDLVLPSASGMEVIEAIQA